MTQPLTATLDNATRRVLGEWHLEEAADPLDDSRVATAPVGSSRVGGRGMEPPRSQPQKPDNPVALYQGFRFEGEPERVDDSLFGPEVTQPIPLGNRTKATTSQPHPQPFPREPVAATTPPPKPGDLIGGFRLISELGRGAFARVYLAEQIELGDRPVALKVSRAEGEEPQMLARLQHTHIVPIHSVHDDPESGLRLLCMPYLGGANLAQVLEEAGARVSDGPERRSLVKALDEVSQRIQNSAAAVGRGPVAAGSRFGSGRTLSEFNAGGMRPSLKFSRPDDANPLGTSRRFGHGSLSRLQGLWDRLAGLRVHTEEGDGSAWDGLDFDQPARQFLRKANTTQAAAWVIARLAEGLEHAHSRGLLHRDLKPSNILIAGDGTPMLLDFNLSTSTTSTDTAEGERAMLGGTLPYMSPEHLDAFDPRGKTRAEAVDERSDVYSLGLILFEMLAGEHAFAEPLPRFRSSNRSGFSPNSAARPHRRARSTRPFPGASTRSSKSVSTSIRTADTHAPATSPTISIDFSTTSRSATQLSPARANAWRSGLAAILDSAGQPRSPGSRPSSSSLWAA